MISDIVYIVGLTALAGIYLPIGGLLPGWPNHERHGFAEENPGIPPVAPALCDAIYPATGKRIRRLLVGNQLS